MMQFVPIQNYQLEVASTGRSNGRILVFRSPDNPDSWNQVGNARVIFIGGSNAKRELKRFLTNNGRPKLQDIIPDGISSSVHTALREYAGL